MEKRKRRRFTAEYEAEAVKRLEESGKALQQVADELGGHANQLRTWRNEQLAIGSAEALARQKAEAAELARLRREVERLEQENEILKRAAAFMGWPAPHSGESMGSPADNRSGADRCRRSRFSGSPWARARAASRAWTRAVPSCRAAG